MKAITLEERLIELGLPETTKFVDWAIWREDKDEYLALYVEEETYTGKAWCKSPEHALIYKQLWEAEQLLKTIPGNYIAEIFDIENQLAAVVLEND